MAPKGRWSRKDKKDDPPAPKGPPVLPVRRTDLDMPDAICVHIENLFTIAECERYAQVLQTEIDWKKQEVTLNRIPGDDKTVLEPRLTAFMSDPGICYEYSKRENIGDGWHPAVLEIKDKATRAFEELRIPGPPVKFNSAQMNRYDGPRSTLGMHCDNEPDLLPGAPIISVSFGATRDFRMQRKDDESRVWNVTLRDGSFLLMAGDMQDKYLHGVPAGGEKMPRFNLTFRVCIPREPRRPNGAALRADVQLADAEEAEKAVAGDAGDAEKCAADQRASSNDPRYAADERAAGRAADQRGAEKADAGDAEKCAGRAEGAERRHHRWRGGAAAARADHGVAAADMGSNNVSQPSKV